MSRPYNLRSRTFPTNYKERDEDEIDDESADEADKSEDVDRQEEDSSSPRRPRNRNTSHRSGGSQSDTSHLSSISSDSFSFHSGTSPSAAVTDEKLYPSLPEHNREQDKSPQRSPVTRRRLYPEADSPPRPLPENRSPDRRQQQTSPVVKELRKQHIEYTYFGFTAKEWKFFFFAAIFAIAMFAAITCFVLFITSFGRTQSGVEKISDFDKFAKQVQGLEKQFPGQTNRFWRVVKSSTRHLFIPELATYPAVLLMVGEKKHAAFVSSIAEAIQREFESVKLHSSKQAEKRKPLNLTTSATNMDVDQQKLHLDEWLKKRLNNKQVAVVVNHLEVLLPESTLLIHAYCDGDNAPYKDVMLIFGLFFDQPVDTSQAAESALRQLWMSEYMRDKVGGVLSRVANNIVLVNGPESQMN